jgi:orotate phosphoribosyltransferase
MNPEQRRQRLLALLREKSVRRGSFVLTSGKTSDLYVDARVTSLHGEGSALIAHCLLERLRPEVVAVGGMTLGADPLACATSALAWEQGRLLHAFLIRKEAKDHGTKRAVEGLANLSAGSPVAVLEDTTTTGGSLLKAVEQAVESGLRVVQTITIVDREEGAKEMLAAAGYVLDAVTTRTELLGT